MAYATFNKPSLHFNTKLYTGSGSTQTITGLGFQPDLCWIKSRTASNHNHNWIDVVRAAPNIIASDSNANQWTDSTDGFTAFATDGFTLGANTAGQQSYELNKSGDSYVSWNWKAGNAQGSSNTDGSINTTYTSVNTAAGFSISQYTGTSSAGTIGHGLGVAPKMILTKRITGGTEDWGVYHIGLSGATHYLKLNAQDSEGSSSGVWNNTAPTNQVFSVGSSALTNGSGTYIAYCFAPKKGFSHMGFYNGVDSSDNTFIYTGFKPAWVMFKRIDSANSWGIFDNKRHPGNVNDKVLDAENANIDSTGAGVDFYSNGISIRSASGLNGDGDYIYLAFAAEPLVANVGSSIPATAE